MSEPTEAPPAPDARRTRPGFIPAAVLVPLVTEITSQLNEPNHILIRQIVIVVGVARARALVQQVLAIEAAGGQMTLDGTRRKTPGGLFISLARAQASEQERPRLRQTAWKKRAAKPPTAPPSPRGAASPSLAQPESPTDTPRPQEQKAAPRPAPAQAKPKPAPVAVPTWEEAKHLALQALDAPGEANTVKLTLLGRPSRVVAQPSWVVVAIKGQAPPALPKGLPIPPANSVLTWAVFIATKHWEKVKESITQQVDDQLIIEGYPLLDPKSGACVVLVTSCKSVLLERAQREAKQSD